MEQRKNTSVGEVESVIAENEKWFKFFRILPGIVTIICVIACLSLGIIYYFVKADAIYLLIFWLGGAAFCVLIYVLLKLVLCYKILHIYYLKKISLNICSSSAVETVETNVPEETNEPDEFDEI